MKKVFVILLCCWGCQKEIKLPSIQLDTFKKPPVNSSIRAVHEAVWQSETGFVEFEQDENLWIEGYVVSSDHAGNFYKELLVQDHWENPEFALRLRLDAQALYSRYPIGQKIYVRLNNLGAGKENGLLSLGSYQADGIAQLAEFLISKHVIRDTLQKAIVPVALTLHEISPIQYGKWVQLKDIQFSKSELHKTYAGEAFDEYDGQRILENCSNYQSIPLYTSTFSDFKSQLLPTVSGFINGILVRDFYDETTVLKINTPKDIVFSQERCDPFYGEHFEEFRLGKVEEKNWKQWQEAGTQHWEVYRDESSLGQSVRIGSYRSGDDQTINWLLSPRFDLDMRSNFELSFRSSVSFGDASTLEVFYSTDWDGVVSSLEKANWESLPVLRANRYSDPDIWIDSGDFAIPMTQSFYLAFVYSGSGKTTRDGTYEIDDIRLVKK